MLIEEEINFLFKDDNLSPNEAIRRVVDLKMKKWEQKGEFEKTDQYHSRVNHKTREVQKDIFFKAALDSIGNRALDLSSMTKKYNADEEYFTILFEGFNPIYVEIPIETAKRINQVSNLIEFRNPKFDLDYEGNLKLIYIDLRSPLNGALFPGYSHH